MPDKYKWDIVTAEAYAGVAAFLSLLPIFFTTFDTNYTTLNTVLSYLYAAIDVIAAICLVITSYY